VTGRVVAKIGRCYKVRIQGLSPRLLPRSEINFVNWMRLKDASVIHQYVQATERLNCFSNQRLTKRRVAKVTSEACVRPAG